MSEWQPWQDEICHAGRRTAPRCGANRQAAHALPPQPPAPVDQQLAALVAQPLLLLRLLARLVLLDDGGQQVT